MFEQLEEITLLQPEQSFFHLIRKGILVNEPLILAYDVFPFELLDRESLGVATFVAFTFTAVLND